MKRRHTSVRICDQLVDGVVRSVPSTSEVARAIFICRRLTCHASISKDEAGFTMTLKKPSKDILTEDVKKENSDFSQNLRYMALSPLALPIDESWIF